MRWITCFQSLLDSKENNLKVKVRVLNWFLTAHLFQFGQSQRVVVFDFELHKAHVCWVGELSDDAETGEQPERPGEIKREGF